MKLLAAMLAAALPAVADSFVPWNPAVDIVAEAPWRLPVEAVAPDGPRVVARDGHFFVGEDRYRAWGVNLSFGANLPRPEDAPKVAGRLAAAGVNAVRMHHMDTAKFPRGLWHREGGFRLDPEGLERLDHFVAALAAQGIRINLNLHVGAQYSRMLEEVPTSTIKYDKLYLQFVPQLQKAWRDYARMVLDRPNPHRGGLRYAEDPAIAWVEVTNENSFWFGGYLDQLRTAPPFYRDMLARQYGAWLRERHRDEAGLRKAWNVKAEPLGADLLAEAGQPWRDEQHNGAKVKRTTISREGLAGARLAPETITGEGWHLQYGIRPIAVKKGQYYTLQFQARSEKTRRIHAAVSMAHAPWKSLGLSTSVGLEPAWRTFRYGFTARADDELARVTISYGESEVPVEIAGLRLQPGGQVGLDVGESLADGKLVLWGGSETPERSNDRLRFLAATEKKFFDMAGRFLRDELRCKSMLVGTQGYGATGLYAQQGMDFTDTHAYWQHPHFPRKPWDRGDWVIRRKAMVDHPQEATLLKLASHRVPGRPFTVSEYNHPAPNDFQVECVPMMAAVAAVEDWDGVWFYTYEHDNDRWDEGLMSSFFDLRANPAKWAFMPLGAVLFREAGMKPREETFLSSLTPPSPEETWKDPAKAIAQMRFNRGGRDEKKDSLATLLYDTRKERIPPKRGFFMADSGGGAVAVGYADDFKAQTHHLDIEGPEFCAIAVASLNGMDAPKSECALLVACGRAENDGMGFSETRDTVGREWGKPPVQAEAVTGTMRLPDGNWRAWALKPDGSRGKEIRVEKVDGMSLLRMSPEHGTICYWLERE